jgi:hypothetical protein
MNTKKRLVTVATIICCIGFFAVRLGGASIPEQEQLRLFGKSTLAGLKGVAPSVKLVIPKKYRRDIKLTDSQLQSQVTSALQKADIKVFEPTNRPASVELLFVTVSLSKVSAERPIYFFKTETELWQQVELVRDKKILTITRTWPLRPESRLIVADSTRVEQAIKDIISEQINDFVNDYLAANPRQQSE